jgi:hypothetical protein
MSSGTRNNGIAISSITNHVYDSHVVDIDCNIHAKGEFTDSASQWLRSTDSKQDNQYRGTSARPTNVSRPHDR